MAHHVVADGRLEEMNDMLALVALLVLTDFEIAIVIGLLVRMMS